MSCSHIEGCELFVQFALNPALEIWKKKFCNGVHTNCARYKLSGLHQPVPVTLLPNGKNIRVVRSNEEFGVTALFNSIAKHRVRMIKSLIHTGVNLNASNVEGTTALMAAVEENSEEMVKLLLEHDVDTSLRNIHGQTAYDLAVEQENTALINLLSKG